MNTPLNKPCLVQTGQGFSVEYQGKLLYSKYNPSRNILRTIENLNLLPETLLICLSPVLDYGVREIIQKVNLSQNSRCLFLEKDSELFELEKNWLDKKSIKENFCLPQELLYYSNNMDFQTTAQRSVSKPGQSLKDRADSLSSNKSAAFLLTEEAPSFIPFFYRNFKGEFKRVQIIDFSAASALYREEYFTFFTKLQNIVNQFWKNRITLMKFGKKYSGNLFKNLKNLSLSCKTQSQNKTTGLLTRKDLSEKISDHWTFPQSSKILLVAGAGESALSTLEWIKKSDRRENFYIIAVDALIKTLKALNIKADALVCEESQAVIARALTGCQNFFDTLFLSITANTSVARKYLTKTIFYTPLYTNSRFLSYLATKGLVQNTFDPLGSVGLTALNIALKIRKNENLPVIVTGLDFSYSKNRTHAPSSFHDRENYKKINRLTTIEKFQSAFSQFSKIAWPCKKQGQENFETFYTLPSLENYKNLFTDRFSSCKNLYDAGITGFELGLEQVQIEKIIENTSGLVTSSDSSDSINTENNSKREKSTDFQSIERFFNEEKKSLLELKDILTGKKSLPEREAQTEILKIISEREYLYLHFADGNRARLSLDFLKRVRAESDYFLKIFQ